MAATFRHFLLASSCLFLVSHLAYGRDLGYAHDERALAARAAVFPRDGCSTLRILNTEKELPIAQGAASDGGGQGYDAPAVLWILFGFIVGTPLGTAGVRGGKLASGAGMALALSVGVWAAFINSMNASGIPDIAVVLVVFVVFVIGLAIGFATIEYGVGTLCLGIVGGLSIGIRIVLLRDGLLIPVFFLNWVIIALIGVVGGMAVLYRERAGVIIGSANAGSFLFILAIDLAVNKQSGMSRGLRFLFDRNFAHLGDILFYGYLPPLSSRALSGVSIGLAIIFGMIQHKVFPYPFWIRKSPGDWNFREIMPTKFGSTKSDGMSPKMISAPMLLSVADNPQSRFSM